MAKPNVTIWPKYLIQYLCVHTRLKIHTMMGAISHFFEVLQVQTFCQHNINNSWFVLHVSQNGKEEVRAKKIFYLDSLNLYIFTVVSWSLCTFLPINLTFF